MKFNDSHKIVILDENLQRRNFLRSIVSETGAVPFFFDTATICLDNVAPIAPDLVIAGPLPKEQAYRMILSLKLRNQRLPVVVFSGDPDVKNFVRQNDFQDVAILGADAEPWELEGALGSLINSRSATGLPKESVSPALIGHSPAMRKFKKSLEALSSMEEAVFVMGEPGSGKEMIARSIYDHSVRCGQPFAKIDLAQLPRQVTSEAFFGADIRSARTGAVTFGQALAAAAGGFLFLDAVEALPLDFQAGLLGYFDGADAGPRPGQAPDARLILTGADNIEQLVHAGRFRKDLYFRIHSIALTIPPLRHRKGDIGLLADFFADQCCMEIGKGHFDLTPALKKLFEGYRWPGNVRELKSAVRAAVVTGSEQPIRRKLSDLMQKGGMPPPSAHTGPIDRLADFSGLRAYLKTQGNLSLKQICQTYTDRIEKRLIKRTLARTQWNRRQAAQLLEISYKSILNKIKQYKLEAPKK